MLKYLIILTLVITTLAHQPFQVRFQWNIVNYTWPSPEAYAKADMDRTYIPENNVIAGIKSWKGNMYLTIPRWKNGVPVTLAVTSALPIKMETAPRLKPYPNWDMQKIGDCAAFQFVHSMEIDPNGRMWVLDTGRTATLTTEPKNNCPPRLVILDLEDDGAVLRSYAFPSNVANPESAYLKDIVVDHEDGGFAYITDADANNPGIIVFSLEKRKSWKITDNSTTAKDEAINFILEGIRIPQPIHIGGVALSPAQSEGKRTLYYTPLSSYIIFAVPTEVLKNETITNISKFVIVLGRKPSQTEGMVMSNTGVLYFGLLADDAISMWDSKNPSFATGQRIISRDHHLLQWPHSFAFDQQNSLLCITNRLHAFLSNTLNINHSNFRAINSTVNMTSYQYYENGTAPNLPTITAGANSFSSKNDILLASMFGLLLVFIMQ